MDNILAWAQKTNNNNETKNLSFVSGASFKYKIIHMIKNLIGRKY